MADVCRNRILEECCIMKVAPSLKLKSGVMQGGGEVVKTEKNIETTIGLVFFITLNGKHWDQYFHKEIK